MRLSTPIWTGFFNKRHQLGISLLRHVNARGYARHGSIAPIVFFASVSTKTCNLHPSIDDLTKKLDSLAPRFELQSGEIDVLTTPEEFYSTLRKKILCAKKRVFLSSLYIGKEETELVLCPNIGD
jgi:hypothetical protein